MNHDIGSKFQELLDKYAGGQRPPWQISTTHPETCKRGNVAIQELDPV